MLSSKCWCSFHPASPKAMSAHIAAPIVCAWAGWKEHQHFCYDQERLMAKIQKQRRENKKLANENRVLSDVHAQTKRSVASVKLWLAMQMQYANFRWLRSTVCKFLQSIACLFLEMSPSSKIFWKFVRSTWAAAPNHRGNEGPTNATLRQADTTRNGATSCRRDTCREHTASPIRSKTTSAVSLLDWFCFSPSCIIVL